MFARFRNDPVGFVRDILGAAGKPYDKQVEILRALAFMEPPSLEIWV